MIYLLDFSISSLVFEAPYK